MTVAVFTPTCRPGGLDVTAASLERQGRDDLLWIVGDTLERSEIVHLAAERGIVAVYFDSRDLTSRWGSLEAAYNQALHIARNYHAQLLVSLQDYIWAPPDGIARFEAMADAHPDALLTGCCSISADPARDQIADPDGAFTIFNEPYTDKPATIAWQDCRLDQVSAESWQTRVTAERWELNWAAIPRRALYDERLAFDERYDDGWAYGNQVYAQRTLELGYELWMDGDNHALGLPHKDYFPEQQARLQARSNRVRHELDSKVRS